LNLVKQYIVQCIVYAANNLRLSTEKVEVVAMLKDHISHSESLGAEINMMKKNTYLSKFAIRLGEIFNYIENNKIDFLKISDMFKEQSHILVRDLSHMLDTLTPEMLKTIYADFDKKDIDIDFSKRENKKELFGSLNTLPNPNNNEKAETLQEETSQEEEGASELKEKYILEDLKSSGEFDFEEYENEVLRPIKEIDSFLNRLIENDCNDDELDEIIKRMKYNEEFSIKVGFEIIANMHKIFYRAVELIRDKNIEITKNEIEGMRACLIVIVAIIRGKDVDISTFLKKAESFGINITGKKRELV